MRFLSLLNSQTCPKLLGMPGGRKTHHFPQGTPLPIVLIHIVAVIVGVLWVVSFSQGWVFAVASSVAWICVWLISYKLLKFYERQRLAISIPRPKINPVRFPAGTPAPLLALRYAAVILVFVMLGFGFAPMSWARAKFGIVGCVLGLLILAVLNIALVFHYVKTGRASEQLPRSEHNGCEPRSVSNPTT